MKPMIKGHEYKHFLAHSLPYNLSYIYGLKVYDRARPSNQKLSRYDIAQSYMIVGGIPYYLQYFKKGLS